MNWQLGTFHKAKFTNIGFLPSSANAFHTYKINILSLRNKSGHGTRHENFILSHCQLPYDHKSAPYNDGLDCSEAESMEEKVL